MRDILIREEQPVKIMYPKGTVPDCKGDLSGNIGRCYRDQVQKRLLIDTYSTTILRICLSTETN